nr:glycosyltransferase family 39 protein [Bacteroidales bacterium]
MIHSKCRFSNSVEWVFILMGLTVAVPLIFFHLGHLPLRVWDEARLAINGYEMLQNHRFFVTTYGGVSDLWNTKPPLLIWLQVLSMKCFGINEAAFRLPSALAVLLTCVLLYVFLRSYLKDFRFGFIQNMVLLTTTGLFTWHGGKNGDYDALLMLLCTAYCLAFFLFLEKGRLANGRGTAYYIYGFYLFLSLAILTKSSGALLFLPGLLLYTLMTGQFPSVLKNRHIYIGLLIPVVSVGGYYICRELAEPGYLQAVWANEFGGRFMTVIEGHREPIWFYVQNLYTTRFGYWFFMALGGAVFGLFGSDRRIYGLTLFTAVLSGSYLLLISLAQTKCFWYDIPLYPFLGVLAAVFLFKLFEALRKTAGAWTAYVFLVCLLVPAVLRIYEIGYIPRETTDWEVDP